MKKTINWDALRHSLGGLLVAGGPIASLLAAQGLAADQINSLLGYATIAVGIGCTIGPILVNVLSQTDRGKADTINRLDRDGQSAVLSLVDPAIIANAAAKHPEIAAVVVKDTANGSLAQLAADPGTPKVITETAAKGKS